MPDSPRPPQDGRGSCKPKPLTEFYEEMLKNPECAAQTARFRAVMAAYIRGEDTQDICDALGVTRTEVAFVVRLSGARRGMDAKSMAPADVANLYALLYAAQLEIESLRAQLKGEL